MLDNIEYANAYSEVLGILRYIPLKDYNKIPERKIKIFEKNANKDYKFYFNPNKTLEQQNVSKRARAIIGILFRDYWATVIQREKIITQQNYDRMKLEEEKRATYNPEKIFNIRQNSYRLSSIEVKKENLEIIEYKETKWYQKIFERILKVFRKK